MLEGGSRTSPLPHPPAAGLSSPAEPGPKHRTRCERPRGEASLITPRAGWGRLAEGAPHQSVTSGEPRTRAAPQWGRGVRPPSQRVHTRVFLPSPHTPMSPLDSSFQASRLLNVFLQNRHSAVPKKRSSGMRKAFPPSITGVIAVSSFFRLHLIEAYTDRL